MTGCALVVWVDRIGAGAAAAVPLSSAVGDRLTLDHVRRIAAEGESLRAQIRDLADQVAAIERASHTTSAGACLIRARHGALATVDLIRKMEAAVQRGDRFVARHLLNEVQREFRVARSEIERAKQIVAGP